MRSSILLIFLLLIGSCFSIQSRLRQATLSSEAISLARGISIRGSEFSDPSIVKFITAPWTSFLLEVDADSGSFGMTHSNLRLLEISPGLFEIRKNASVRSLHFSQNLLAGPAPHVKQWKLFTTDIESAAHQVTGWSDNSTYQCGEIFMLGGYNNFAKGEVKKVFDALPEHTELRITGSFHFIDQWLGETGFVQLNSHLSDASRLEYVWVQKYDTSKISSTTNAINVCGSEYPEFQLSQHIDIVIPHVKERLIITVGATIETDNPAEASFGFSNLAIYIR